MAVTILIFKKDDEADLINWRSISLNDILYKLYVGCIANRLTDWLTSNKALSPCQKGFLPADGAFEHVYTLNRLMEKTRCSKTERCVVWLDISNALGAVPHAALLTVLEPWEQTRP